MIPNKSAELIGCCAKTLRVHLFSVIKSYLFSGFVRACVFHKTLDIQNICVSVRVKKRAVNIAHSLVDFVGRAFPRIFADFVNRLCNIGFNHSTELFISGQMVPMCRKHHTVRIDTNCIDFGYFVRLFITQIVSYCIIKLITLGKRTYADFKRIVRQILRFG